jgi:hypothetical protein
VINQVNPGKFSYWVRVTAAAGSNTFTISQAITTGNFDTLFALTSGSSVFYSNCTNGPKPRLSQGPRTGTTGGTVAVTWSAPSADTYYISVKFDSTSVTGKTAPNPTTVHDDFSTTGVAGSTSGIDLIKKPTGSALLSPEGGVNSDFIALLSGRIAGYWTIDGGPPFWQH